MSTVAVPDQPTTVAPDRRTLRHHRIAISAAFFLAGAIVGAWTARIPAVRHHLHLSDMQLSVALLALAAGGLAGMRAVGAIVDRYGPRAAMVPTMLLLGGALAGVAFVPNLLALAAVLLLIGTLHGSLNTSMNAAAAGCQAAYGRPIMTSCHAQFSIGGAAGAAGAVAAAKAGLGTAAIFIVVGATLTLLALLVIRWLPRAAPVTGSPQTDQPSAAPAPTVAGRRVLLLGVLAYCALIAEGAAADWSSMYAERVGATSVVSGAAYAAFAGAMTAGRLAGDRISAMLSPVTLLRAAGALAATGLATGIVIGTPAAAVAGFGLLGAGLSCVVPQLYSAAGSLDPARRGAVLSRVAALGYLGYVTGPVIIGATATHIGLRPALLILPVLTGLIAAAAPVVRLHAGARDTSSQHLGGDGVDVDARSQQPAGAR
jgi:MFS family permease